VHNLIAPASIRQAQSAPIVAAEHPTMPLPHFLETLLDRPIAFHRVFAELTNSLNAGIMLSQAVYWSKRTKDPAGWFYKSRDDWFAETFLLRRAQENARAILRESRFGLPTFWQEELRGVPARLYYRIDFDLLLQQLQRLHLEQGRNVPTENNVQPDLTEVQAIQQGRNVPTSRDVTYQLEGTKRSSKRARFVPARRDETSQHANTETTTETTHNSGRVVCVPKEKSAEEEQKPRSAFTIKQWLAYAKTQPNINNKMAFANAMARTPDNDCVLELHLEIQRQEKEPVPLPGCKKCRNSPGWELVPGKGVKPCACRTPAN
jgi:hypothetical protein